MSHRQAIVSFALLTSLALATPASAFFHDTVIDEVLTSYGGDANVQFIEMRMLAGLQSFVTNSVFAAFDNQGNYVGDILVVPSDLKNSGNGSHWLIATAAFQTQTGLEPDFVMPTGMLQVGGGMVCFGGGGGISPASPSSWSRTNFPTYVDCLAYGTYSGPSNTKIGTPTALDADGHALQRVKMSQNDSADFACADPATVQNNAPAMVMLAASVPCGGGAPTPTPTPEPTLTPPATVSTPPSPSGTLAPAHPCTGDCNGDGAVTVAELIVAVNIVLGNADRNSCPGFGAELTLTISDLITAVNSVLNGCPATPTPLIG